MSNIAWYETYPLRFERKGDIPLFSKENIFNTTNKSNLSPTTNIVLNTLSIRNDASNFIICIPSSILRPLPIISYILAKKSNGSVLVFSGNKKHYNSYHLLKKDYQFIWNDIPAGEIKKGSIYINPKVPPYASRNFKAQLKRYIPVLKQKFLQKDFSKVLFYHDRNIRFADSFQDLFVERENVVSSLDKSNLGINIIIFENLDNIIYNDFLFNTFKEWIAPLKSNNYQFILHISNPDYKYLTEMREFFKSYVLYFPYSFLKSNEDLSKKNNHYFNQLKRVNKTDFSVINEFNLERAEIYSTSLSDKIQIQWKLKKGNIDNFFGNGMDLFSKLDWRQINKNLISVVYKIKKLFFSVYRTLCIPKEFTVKYYDDQFGFKRYSLNRFLPLANKLIDVYSSSQTKVTLKNILTYLVNMVNELSECKRFGEDFSYSRIGKNYTICEFLENYTGNDSFIIGVQQGEMKALSRIMQNIHSKTQYKIISLHRLSRSIADFSDYVLILSGSLLDSNIQILFKTWKRIIFLLYKGNNHKWVKQQIKLVYRIDISKEELTLKYLADIIRELIQGESYDLEQDPLFSNFLRKKERLLSAEQTEIESDETVAGTIGSIFDKEIKLTTTTIREIYQNLMKSDPRFKHIIAEQKIKSLVKKDNLKKYQKLVESEEGYDCACKVTNEINGNILTVNLDIKKTYMYFNDKDNVKIEYGFPYSLQKDSFLILFGEFDKLSATDFIKDAFGLEDDIDHDMVYKWQGNLSAFYYNNYKNYSKFYNDFKASCKSTISYTEFKKWVKGEVNAPLDPENLNYLGQVMNDSFILENFELICQEGRKIQKFHIRIGKLLKKLIVKILKGKIERKECSIEELGLLDEIENCIFKIIDIQINNGKKK